MKEPGNPLTADSGGKSGGVLLLLLAVLSLFFYQSFQPGKLVFSNDGPVGRLMAECHNLPDSFTGVWNDLNSVGYREQGALTSITSLLRMLLGSVVYSKFYAPAGLFIAGLGAWFMFRETGLSRPACVLGALAMALNTDFFSTACWGIAAVPITIGTTCLALAALAKGEGWRGWLRTLIAGMCIGIGLADGADVGVLFSMVVAGVILFDALIQDGTFFQRASKGLLRLLLVVFFAALVAAQPISALVKTQVDSVSPVEHVKETPASHWDWATQWSLPKRETLALVVPGLFGYRTDSEGAAKYWGEVGRDAEWTRYLDSGEQGPEPRGFKRYIGSGIYSGITVVLVGLWAVMQTLLGKSSAFSGPARNRIRFWAVSLAVALLLGFGRFAPFYGLIYHLPYFKSIRNPIKFIEIFNFAVVVVFAYGVDGLWKQHLKSDGSRKSPLVAKFSKYWCLGSLLVFFLSLVAWGVYASHSHDLEMYLQTVFFTAKDAQALAASSIQQVQWYVFFFTLATVLMSVMLAGGFLGKRAVLGIRLLGLLVFLDYYNADVPWVRYYDYNDKFVQNPIIDQLAKEPYLHRVTAVPFYSTPHETVFNLLHYSEWLQNLYPSRNIQAIDLVQASRIPTELENFIAATRFDSDAKTFPNLIRRYQLTNTRYFLGSAGFADEFNTEYDPIHKGMKVVSRFNLEFTPDPSLMNRFKRSTSVLTPDGEFALMEFEGALPRAKLFGDWECNSNSQAVLKELIDPAFDCSRKLIVTESIPKPEQSSFTNLNEGQVSIEDYSSKKVVLAATANRDCVMLLNDRYDPDWKVKVDNRPASILHCNFLMRGVYLSPGTHHVEFTFQPSTLPLFISLTAVLSGLILLALVAIPGTKAAPVSEAKPEALVVEPESPEPRLSKKARRRLARGN